MTGTAVERPEPDTAALGGPAPARRPVLAVVLVVLIALLVGLAGGALIGRPSHPGPDSAEAGFTRDMAVHHGQAVEMSGIVHAGTGDAEIRQLAVDIMLTQQAQLGIFQTWLHTWDVPLTGDDPPMAWMASGGGSSGGMSGGMSMTVGPDGLMPGMATAAELAQLRAGTGRARDVLWCQLMLRHHLGGVEMAGAVLDRTDERQVRELAQRIEQGQAAEIVVLQGLLTRLGAEALPAR